MFANLIMKAFSATILYYTNGKLQICYFLIILHNILLRNHQRIFNQVTKAASILLITYH